MNGHWIKFSRFLYIFFFAFSSLLLHVHDPFFDRSRCFYIIVALLPGGFSHLRLHFLQLSFSCYSQSQCLAQLRSSLKFVLNLMPVILKSCTGNQNLVIWSACYKFYIWHMSCSSSPLLPRSFLWLRLSLGRFVRLFNSRGRLVTSLIRVSKLKLSSSYRHWH